MRIYLFLIAIVLSVSVCTAQQDFSLDSVTSVGRTLHSESLISFWPGTAWRFRFKGTDLTLAFNSNKPAWLMIFIDGLQVSDLKVVQHTKFLVPLSSRGWHEIEIYRRSEIDAGPVALTRIFGLGSIRKGPRHQRLIEFIGDSITAGYALDDPTGKDTPDSTHSNPREAYASLTARKLKAEAHLTVKSGIGITISWFPGTMPEIWQRLNPEDSASIYHSKVSPDAVVINLFQNDSWLVKMPKYDTFVRTFGTTPPTEAQLIAAYRNFLATVRQKYPTAPIICALGTMDAAKSGSPWPGYVTEAIQQLGDKAIYFVDFGHIPRSGHPNREDQQHMAKLLSEYLRNQLNW